MPILMHISELEPGMILARNIMNRYSVLLGHNHRISEKDIASLARVLPDVPVYITDPLLDQGVEFDDDSRDHEVSLEVRRNISNVVDKVSNNIRSGVTLTSENVAGMQKTIDDMMEFMQDNPVTSVLIEQSHSWDDYLQEHSANVFYLSMVIGNTIRNYIKIERERLSFAKSLSRGMNITPLATSALLHDIGMSQLERLYHKREPLTEQEIEQLKNHPQAGADMLPDEINPMVKMVVRSHHENQDGTGYPNGLPGDKINIFARIIRIADAYSAATSNRIYQKAKPSPLVLYEMLHGKYNKCYDPVVLRVFSNIVQPFPIGAKLKLNNGKWAVVVRHNSRDLFRPEVIIAFDELGDPIPRDMLEKPFQLGQSPGTSIQSFGNEEMTFLNDLAAQPVPVPDDREDQPEKPVYSELFDFAYP